MLHFFKPCCKQVTGKEQSLIHYNMLLTAAGFNTFLMSKTNLAIKYMLVIFLILDIIVF